MLVKQRGRVRTHLAHFFTADKWETCNQRIFSFCTTAVRDWLQGNADDRLRYERVKRAAAEQAAGRREYTARKTVVVQEIVDRARAAQGLPSVNVWDK